MRNNERILAPVIPTSEKAPESIVELPNENYIPGLPMHSEPVSLPSRGIYYHPTNPLFEQESIELKYPTTKEQDILLNKSYIAKQIAIDKVLESVIGNPAINLKKMLLGDKNALAYQTRINMHGQNFSPKFVCPFCLEKAPSTEIDLEASKDYKIPKTAEELAEKGITLKNLEGYITFLYTSKVSKVQIEFALATGETEDNIRRLSKNQEKNKLPEATISNQLKCLVTSVNGVRGIEVLQFVERLPSIDVTQFMDMYNFVSPDVSFKHDFTCSSCGFEDRIAVPIDVNFFWYRP